MTFIGLDIGSTAVKAVAVDDKGNILARGKQAYLTEVSGVESTQHSSEWWNAAVSSIRQVVAGLKKPGDVFAMSVSAQGGSIFALDKNNKPLTQAMTWMDRRGFSEAEEIREIFGDKIYRSCGWPTAPSDCASKLFWLKRHKPDIFSKAEKFLTTGDYINYKLTGRAVSDPSGAAITRLYNINTRHYENDILGYLGVTNDKLPEVYNCGTELGYLSDESAEELGFGKSIMVYNGAHDQYCASLGSGVVHPGEMLLATGTAWVVFGIAQKLVFNEKHIAPGIHPIEGRYGVMTSLGGIGAEVENYARRSGVALYDIDRIAYGRCKTARSLLICPCQSGKGIVSHREGLYGLENGLCNKAEYDLYDCSLALMEGAAFEVKLTLEEFRRQGMSADRTITMSGGAVRSKLWSSLVGYICDNDVMLTEETDTPALGAAMIAAVNSGAFTDYETCSRVFVRKKPLVLDNPELRGFYSDKFNRYRDWCVL